MKVGSKTFFNILKKSVKEAVKLANPDVLLLEADPCPFCGGEGEAIANGEYRYVRCLKCGASGKKFDVLKESGNNIQIKNKAIRAWNKRCS